MSNTTTVRYEYHEPQAPLFLKATWVRIENTVTEHGMVIERVTPIEKPEIASSPSKS
jgi:hypothetical protein